MSNAKGGTNKGRRIRLALGRFGEMLIREAREIGGFTFEELDGAFGFTKDRCAHYLIFSKGKKKSRAPQADEIQDLENKVARILKRLAHRIDVENFALLEEDPFADIVIGSPDLGKNLREFVSNDFGLCYEDDWPTYSRLTVNEAVSPDGHHTLLELYRWPWGVLWDRCILPLPWTREEQGFPLDVPIEQLLPTLVEKAKALRREIEEN